MSIARLQIAPTGHERTFANDEIIVSKTDLAGRITYANHVFLRVSGYAEEQLLGAPHSVIRHPDMPRAVFKLAWDQLLAGDEVFAYVNNLAANGDHYWVLAHITPSFGPDGSIVGFHSNRRVPEPRAVRAVEPLYATLRAEEQQHRDRADGLRASTARLTGTLAATGLTYDAWIWTL
jgi:PAS domain S-box-containing protein